MKELTNGICIIEQKCKSGSYTLAIPKKHAELIGCTAGESLYFSIFMETPQLIIKYVKKEPSGESKKRNIIGSNGFLRIPIPKIKGYKHRKGFRWDCYATEQSLYYIRMPETSIKGV